MISFREIIELLIKERISFEFLPDSHNRRVILLLRRGGKEVEFTIPEVEYQLAKFDIFANSILALVDKLNGVQRTDQESSQG